MTAERAYFFRHALLRDAAYQLQLPGDRARLHALAFTAIEELAGGRAPELPPRDPAQPVRSERHRTDPFAEDLAGHANVACQVAGANYAAMQHARELYLRRAAAHFELAFDYGAAERLWRRSVEVVPPDQKGISVRWSALAALQAGRIRDAERGLEEALALHREAGQRRLEGVVLGNLASLYHESGRIECAEATFSRALAIHREVGNRRFEGAALGILARVHYSAERLEPAEKRYREAIAILRDVGDLHLEGVNLFGLALAELARGRAAAARDSWRQGVACLQQAGDGRELQSSRNEMVAACFRAGTAPLE